MRDSGSLRMGEMELRGRVCAGKNCGLGNVTLTIKSHARENAAVFRVYCFWVLMGNQGAPYV